jgi:long-chain acyl-CoA synthetase
MSIMSQEKPWITHWPNNVAQSLDYPKLSLGEVLRTVAARSPESTALFYSGREFSYGELDSLADHFAAALQNLGIVKGDRIAIYLPNLPQFVFAYYGALRAGAIVVTASPLYKERELSHILSDSAAKVLVCLDKLHPYVESVKGKSKFIQVFTTGASDYLQHGSDLPTPSDAMSLRTLLADHESLPKAVEIDAKNDLALFQYTGGTTGVPKGAMLTHYNLVVNAVQVSSWLGMRPGAEVNLSVLPFFHIYGMTVAMNVPVYTSSPMILIPDPRDIDGILRGIDMCKPTVFCGVPAMYIALINRPDIGKHDLRSIRVCVSGASALPFQVQKKFEELTGGRLVEGYGLTETSPVTHVNPIDELDKNKSGSIGIPISDTEAKIVDLEAGERHLPAGTVGELVIRGPQVMMGYWNNEEESRVALRGGWFHTGDIATMDQDGYFHIMDRKKDMINVSGLKVWPREVEEVLYEHPAVKEAAAVPIPDPTSGEAVKAYVVVREEYNGKVTAQELAEFCKLKIADYKAPKIVEFRDVLPKSAIGKILRRELRVQQTE